MEAIKDMFLFFTPEVPILMPVGSLLLGVLKCPVQIDISNSGHLLVFLVLVVETEKFRKLNDTIPDSFRKFDHLFFIEVNVLYANASMVIESFHDMSLVGDQILH
jgi:hypothetical protein